MPFYSPDTVDPLVQRLRVLANELPELKDAAKIYEAILPLLRDADLHAGTISLTAGQVREKMASGVPLLSGLDLDFDLDAARALMIKLAAAVEEAGRKHHPLKLRLWFSSAREPDSAARRIRIALEENTLKVDALLSHVAAGDNDAVASGAKDLELDPGLTLALAQNALKPALRAWCTQLTPVVKGIPWHKSSCFICGATATLAELQENDQVKHLRCGSCGADWQVRRLQCVYCGNEDHRTLPHLFEEKDFERIQLEACDKCRGYLKVIAAFSPTLVELLAIEDLATLHLDYIAKERGYTRGVEYQSVGV
jgi:formate dehydrogenase maturation protein FdhE